MTEVQDQLSAPTAPPTISLNMRAFAEEERAKAFGSLLYQYVYELSRTIDCSMLDGITIAFDYEAALAELDRGYEASIKLSATRDVAVGIAMTPGVLRSGVHKSHMVFNADYLGPLEDSKHQDFGWVIHIIAHEMAHVEVAAAFDRAFPGVLLRERSNYRQKLRNDAILGCWDEYAVTWRVALIGRDPLPDYTQTLVEVLEGTRPACIEAVGRYMMDRNTEDLVATLYYRNAALLKYASYFAGTMVRQGLALEEVPAALAAIGTSWFQPYFDRLLEVMSTLNGRFGQWEDRAEFEPIADIVEAMIADVGVELRPMADGFYAWVSKLAR